jgi:hypothetical protein
MSEYEYVKQIAVHLWTRYYKAESPQWEPLPELTGVLTQIDNMIAGLNREALEAKVSLKADYIKRLEAELEQAKEASDDETE